MSGLNNKVVLITGSSSGIGAETAVEFARYGARLALTGRSIEGLEKTASRCEKVGVSRDDIFMTTGDVTKQNDVTRIVESTVEHFGCLDVLINIAGGLKTMRFHNCPVEKVTEFFHWNVTSQFMMNTAAMYHLIASKGNIVNMGSMAGNRPYPALFPFSIAKAAGAHGTRCLGLELGPKGVRVNSVEAGSITDTQLWKRSGICPTKERETAHHEKSWPLYPLRRLGKCTDVASAIVFLASDDASYITGYNMPIDGGMGLTAQTMM